RRGGDDHRHRQIRPAESGSSQTLPTLRGWNAGARPPRRHSRRPRRRGFERCFVAWVAAQTGVPAEVVAIDGKTVRRSGSKTSKKKKKDSKGPIHIVSAFAARQRL